MAERDSFFATRRLEDAEDASDDLVTSNDSAIIRETLRFYGSWYLACFLLYCCLRQRYPRIFNIRSWVPELECDLAKREYDVLSWFWKVFDVPDQAIFDDCGMDALCFIRALRMGRKLAICGMFNAIWLIPMYATAGDSAETDYLSDPLVIASLSNLPSGSPRFFGTVLATYITFFYSMFLIFKEFKWYTRWRHKFLAKPWPRNYAVYVSGIPDAFRSSHELAKYFQQCSSDTAVIEAHIAMDIPLLEAKVARRKIVVAKLEHVVALGHKTGETQTHTKVRLRHGMQKVDSISEYESELHTLNRDIQQSVTVVLRESDRFRRQLIRTNASINLMQNKSMDWIGEDEASDAADYQVSSPIHSIKSGDTGDETNPLLTCLSVVPEDETLYANLSREEADVAAVDEGPDGVYVEHLAEHAVSGTSLLDSSGRIEPNLLFREPETPYEVSGTPSSLDQLEAMESASDVSAGEVEQLKAEDSSRTVETVPCPSLAQSDNGDSGRSAFSTRSSVSGKSTNSSGSSVFHSQLSKGSKAAGSVTRSIASGSREFSQSLASGSRVVGNSLKRAVPDFKTDALVKNAQDKSVATMRKAKVVGNSIRSSAGAVVPMILSKEEGQPRTAGFILFSSLYAATSAKQTLHHPKPYKMDVQDAPNPGDLFWRNVGLTDKARRTGGLMSFTASGVLCIFWSFPMAFISSLTEISSLKEALPKLGAWLDEHPGMEPLFAQLAPLLLLFFNEVLLPSILKWFATWEGFISGAMLEASLFVKLGVFMIIQTFFVSAISGGITSELSNILNNPESVIDLLANSLPAQSSYFIQILLASTFLIQSLEFLRVYPLGMAFLRRYIGPNLTAKERRETRKGINSLEDPPDFWLAETFAMIILYVMVFFVYAAIAPTTSFFLYFCFILLESGYRYQYFHNYPRAFDTGGKLWLTFIQFTFACMIISQLTLIGLLVLKQSAFAGPAMGPLLAITILFIIFINGEHIVVTRNLPTRDCLLLDQKNTEAGLDDDYFGRGKYLQPALNAEAIEPNFEDSDEADEEACK